MKVERIGRIVTGLLLCAGVLFLYRSVLGQWLEFVELDQTYSYALLVVPVALGLVALKLHDVGWSRFLGDVEADRAGYGLIAAGCLMLLAGRATLLLFVVRLSFLVTLTGLVLALLGRRNLRRLAFPLGFLLFTVPLPATIYLPLSNRLQLVSSAMAGHSLDLLRVPALREGNIIALPNARLDVAQACSGIHSLFALTATATLAAYMLVEGLPRRTLVVLSAAPVAIVFNGLRITATALMTYRVGPQAAEGVAHASTGVVAFTLGCAAILGVCALVGRAGGSGHVVAPGAKPQARSEAPAGGGRRFAAARWNVIAALVIAGFAFALRDGIRLDHAVALQRPLAAFPLRLGQWQGREVEISKRQLESLDASAVLTREYAAPGHPVPVDLYVVYYSRQNNGATMHSPLHCIPGAGWEVNSSSAAPVPSAGRGDILANRMVFEKDGHRILVVYWYMQQGEPERSQLSGVMMTLWRSVFERRSDGCLIRLSAPMVGGEQKTFSELMAFARRAVPILVGGFLPGPSENVVMASKR